MHVARPAAIVAVAALAAASSAFAGPRAEVIYYGSSTVTAYDYTAPYAIERSHADDSGTGHVLVDMPAGLLRVSSTATPAAVAFAASGLGEDAFTLWGGTPGTVVPVTASLAADGTGLITLSARSGSVHLTLYTPGADPGVAATYQAFANSPGLGNAPFNASFPISHEVRATFDATVGTPFTLAIGLRLDAGAGTSFDFDHTARLAFADLPAGMYVTSSSGFTTVPEPGSGAAATAAVAACGLRLLEKRRRRRDAR